METQIAVSALIDKLLSDRTLAEWEFLYIHTYVLLRGRMTADRIGKSYEYKLVGRSVDANSQRLKALSKALRAANLDRATVKMDVRYAFTIRDNNNKDLITLFMDWSNRFVSINGIEYNVNRELSGWFQDLARDVVKIA